MFFRPGSLTGRLELCLSVCISMLWIEILFRENKMERNLISVCETSCCPIHSQILIWLKIWSTWGLLFHRSRLRIVGCFGARDGGPCTSPSLLVSKWLICSRSGKETPLRLSYCQVEEFAKTSRPRFRSVFRQVRFEDELFRLVCETRAVSGQVCKRFPLRVFFCLDE